MRRQNGSIIGLWALLLAWSAPVHAQMDPLHEVDSLVKVIMADSAAFRQLPTDVTKKWPIELRAHTLHQKAVAGLVRGKILQSESKDLTASRTVLDGVVDLLSSASDERALACAYYFQGVTEMQVNNIAGAIVQCERALHITARVPYPKLDGALERDIGWCYSQMEEFSQARAHVLKSLTYPLAPHERYIALSYLAEFEIPEGLFSEALLHIQQMAALGDSLGIDPGLISLAYGELALAQGKYAEAGKQFKVAMAQFTAKNNITFQTWIMSRLSNTYRLAGRTALAIESAKQGLRIAVRNGLPKETLDNEEQLYQAYAMAGNKAAAFDHFQRFITLQDSSNGAEASGIMATSVLRSQMDRQARTDSLLRAEKDLRIAEKHKAEMDRERTQRNIFLIAGLALACFTTVALRQRAKIKKERDRSEMLLLNILPEEVAEELKAKGEAEAQLIDQVTVLFTDFKGFTAMSEQMSPKQLVHDLHECFCAFDNICERHGIEKIKTIGDAYMAAGGLPVPNATHATDCIQAALEMRDFIAEGKARKVAAGLPFFEIRIGVHTGPVVAGIVGVKKFQYDIWGDTVNTASRMESSGEAGRVNMSHTTYDEAKDVAGLDFTPRGQVMAKGKGEMEMYFVDRS